MTEYPNVQANRLPLGDNGRPGIVFPTGRGWFWATFTATANRMLVARGVLPPKSEQRRSWVFHAIRFGLATNATNDDTIELAVWDRTMTSILATTGQVTGKVNTGAGQGKSVPLTGDLTLDPGIYNLTLQYFAVGGTAAGLMGAAYANAAAGRFWGTTNGLFDGEFVNTVAATSYTTSPFSGGGGIATTIALALEEA